MKKILLMFTLQFLCGVVFSQIPPPKPPPEPAPEEPKEKIYEFVDEPADYPGGLKVLLKYLSDQIVYPEEAVKNGIEGKCFVQFVVTDSGKIKNITLKRGVPNCPECDKEALRVLETMPDWIPGKVNGKKVSSYFSLPIMFKL